MFALAALAMTNTSCQDELESAANDANEVAVSFKVQLENAVGSRAVGDGTTAKELQYAVYKVDANGNTIGTNIAALNGETTVKSDLTAEVTFTLVKGQTYNFMFWAQKPGTPNDGNDDNAYYKLDKSTAKVEIDYKTNNDANDEGRDAFYAVEKSLKVTGPINKTIVLKRPFAQINVGTSIGSLADAKKAEVDITRSKMTIKKAANKLDFFTGKVSATTSAVDVAYDIANIPELTEAPTDAEGGLKDVTVQTVTSDYEYLAMNYILVDDHEPVNGVETGAEKGLVNVEFSIYTANDATPINTFDVPNVPVQRNWRTNIIGDILNENVTFNVVIDPKFDTDENGEDHNYNIAEELAYAAQNGGTVTLQKNITLEAPLVVKANMVLDLGQYTITGGKPYVAGLTGTDISAITIDGGNLTIKGAGTITGSEYGVYAKNGTLTIKEGNYTGATSAVQVAKGTVNIEGGNFAATGTDQRYVINCIDANYKNKEAIVNITGGKFTNFDPANNAAEGNGTNFVADGYKSVNVGTTAAPVYEVIVAPTADANGNMALADNGIVMNSIIITDGGALDGKGHTLTVAGTPATNLLIKGTGDATVKNLTVKGNGEYYDTNKSTRALYFDGTMGDVIISNVHVSGVGYALNVNSSNGSGKLNVSNSTLVGWSSFAAVFTEAKFTNVHFGIGTYFDANSMFNGGIRPYMTTVFENCTFEEGYTISCTEIDTNKSLTFKNCKVGNTTLDATNIWTLLKKEGTPDANSIKF